MVPCSDSPQHVVSPSSPLSFLSSFSSPSYPGTVNCVTADGVMFAHPLHHLGKHKNVSAIWKEISWHIGDYEKVAGECLRGLLVDVDTSNNNTCPIIGTPL